MATFKCNQHRKPAKSWRADKPPGGLHPAPPSTAPSRDGQPARHLPGQTEPGRKLLNTKGCRKELRAALQTFSHTCWHGLKASQTKSSYFGSWRSTARKASMATRPKKKEGRRILAVGNI